MNLTTPDKIRNLQRSSTAGRRPSRAEVSSPDTCNERPAVVCFAVQPVGKPGAGNQHARFDERGWETGRWPKGPKLPRPSSTLPLRKRICLAPRAASWLNDLVANSDHHSLG